MGEKSKRRARKRAKRGAKWLDKVYPEWREHVDPDTLDMSAGGCCIFGQMVGGGVVEFIGPNHRTMRDTGFMAAVRSIFGNATYYAETDDFLARLGFIDTSSNVKPADYSDLDEAWIEVLTSG